jgi:hypothetical protein
LDLRIKNYGCLKFQGEVWAGGHVLEPTSKSWPVAQKVEGKKKKKFKKNGYSPIGWGVDPRLAGNRGSMPQLVRLYPFFWKKVIYKFYFFGSWGNGPRLLGEWVYSTPIFWSLPLYLEVLILLEFIESGDFTFFQKNNSKFSAHLDLHIYRWDFCFMKKWIH